MCLFVYLFCASPLPQLRSTAQLGSVIKEAEGAESGRKREGVAEAEAACSAF